jgi:hypothetical protein
MNNQQQHQQVVELSMMENEIDKISSLYNLKGSGHGATQAYNMHM